MLVVPPLQMVCVAGVPNTSGIGLTFTVMVRVALVQPAAVAHTVYTTLPAVFGVVKLNTWLMSAAALGPVELLAPATPLADIVHSYNVPATMFGLVKLIVGVPVSQIVNTVLLIANVGDGSTVITTSNVLPEQPFAVGVMV